MLCNKYYVISLRNFKSILILNRLYGTSLLKYYIILLYHYYYIIFILLLYYYISIILLFHYKFVTRPI